MSNIAQLRGPLRQAGLHAFPGFRCPSGWPLPGSSGCRNPCRSKRRWEIALRSNPTMQATRNDVRVATWNLTAAYGSWLPSASLGSSLSWQGAGEQRFGSITADQLGFRDQPSFLSSSYNAGVSLALNGRMLMAARAGQAKPRRHPGAGAFAGGGDPAQPDPAPTWRCFARWRACASPTGNSRGRSSTSAWPRDNRRSDPGNAIDVHQAEVAVGRAQVTQLQSQTGVRTSRVRLLQQMGRGPLRGADAGDDLHRDRAHLDRGRALRDGAGAQPGARGREGAGERLRLRGPHRPLLVLPQRVDVGGAERLHPAGEQHAGAGGASDRGAGSPPCSSASP